MPSFLERYLDGECEPVWADLAALGPAVREAAYADDARAVARETMRRARTNLELIVERLDGLGYAFWNGVQGPKPAPGKHIAVPAPKAVTFGTRRLETATTLDLLAAMFAEARAAPAAALTPVMAEQLFNIYRTAVWPWQDTARLMRGERHPADAAAVALFDAAKKAVPGDLAALIPELERAAGAAIDQLRTDWEAREAARPQPPPARVDHRKVKRVLAPPRKKDIALIDRLEAEGRAGPLALRAWIEEVGAVNLAGSHPALCAWEGPGFAGIHADPLMVALDFAELDAWRGEAQPGSLDVVVGWDARTKARLTLDDIELDFGYAVTLPDAIADPPLKGLAKPTTFVGYLRRAFAFGGFPGWADQAARPDAELARLTDGLLPI